jgi:hypothetical protein
MKIMFCTVKGSILGHVLYAIFVLPLVDIVDREAFAIDNFSARQSVNLKHLIRDMA